MIALKFIIAASLLSAAIIFVAAVITVLFGSALSFDDEDRPNGEDK